MDPSAWPEEDATLDAAEYFDREFEEHMVVAEQARRVMGDRFPAILGLCLDAVRAGNKLLFFGNGGSAADAQHLAAELVVRYRRDRKALAAIALTTDTSTLTAGANDLGYDRVFSRQVEALGRPGDVAIGITTSGRSPNVLEAFRSARETGVKTVAFTGGDGGDLLAGACPTCGRQATVSSFLWLRHGQRQSARVDRRAHADLA